jgi:hypothetical protein
LDLSRQGTGFEQFQLRNLAAAIVGSLARPKIAEHGRGRRCQSHRSKMDGKYPLLIYFVSYSLGGASGAERIPDSSDDDELSQ